jgi:outer membrane protein assembly factor BamD
VGPANATPLAPIEHAAAAPDTINDAAGGTATPAAVPTTNGKNPKVDCDKSDESCSRHKKKKGLAKLNPF